MASELYDLCDAFETIASISVSDNTDPTLKELSEIEDFDDRVEFCKDQGWKLLGEGSARAAFQIDDKKIIKIAINERGLDQNKAEAHPEMQKRGITNPIFAADAKGKWIICANNDSINEKEFEKLTGMSFTSYGNALSYKFDSETDDRPPHNYEDIEHNVFFKAIAKLILDTDLLPGDCTKISSYGKIDNRVVIRDTGLTRDVYDKDYKSTSSSS